MRWWPMSWPNMSIHCQLSADMLSITPSSSDSSTEKKLELDISNDTENWPTAKDNDPTMCDVMRRLVSQSNIRNAALAIESIKIRRWITSESHLALGDIARCKHVIWGREVIWGRWWYRWIGRYRLSLVTIPLSVTVWPQFAINSLVRGFLLITQIYHSCGRTKVPNVTWDHRSVPAKWHLIPSNGFCRLHKCDKWHTYRPRYGNICRNRRSHWMLSAMPPRNVDLMS